MATYFVTKVIMFRLMQMERQDAIYNATLKTSLFIKKLLHVGNTEYKSTCSTKYGTTIHIT